MSKHFLLLLFFILVFSGCSNLKQLLTLKETGDETASLDKYVEAQNKKFQALLDACHSKEIEQYKTSKSLLAKFGEPIYRNTQGEDMNTLDTWMYRWPTKYFDSEKITFYIDSKGNVMAYQFEEAPAEEKEPAR